MPDTISTYRQVRLILNPQDPDWNTLYWHLHFLSVKRGIPSTRIVADGSVLHVGGLPSVPSIAEVLQGIGRVGLMT